MTEPRVTSTAQREENIAASCRRIANMWPAMHQAASSGSFAAKPAPKAMITHDDDDEALDDLPRLDVLIDLRASVTAVLNSWARVLVEDRELTVMIPDGHDVPGLARLIERHANWWSGHEAAKDLDTELGQAAHDVSRAVFPHRSSLIPIGACIECGETVRARPGSTWVTCRKCGCEGSVSAWLNVLTDPELLRPTTTTGLVGILRRRLGMRVTDRTLRRWTIDGLIEALDAFGPQPRWPRYDPVLVMRAVTRLYRACAACGRPWNGEHDVCLTCRPHMPTKPTKARTRRTPTTATVRGAQPTLVVFDEATFLTPEQRADLYGPGRRCPETGSPRAWCLCAGCAA